AEASAAVSSSDSEAAVSPSVAASESSQRGKLPEKRRGPWPGALAGALPLDCVLASSSSGRPMASSPRSVTGGADAAGRPRYFASDSPGRRTSSSEEAGLEGGPPRP